MKNVKYQTLNDLQTKWTELMSKKQQVLCSVPAFLVF